MKKKESGQDKTVLVPVETIDRKILEIRGQKVLLDSDLATLYGVSTANLNKAVKRNTNRFPVDFMFQLEKEEFESLIFQFGISNAGRGGRRSLPFVFTEQGVAMLSGVLNSERAIEVNIGIMRAFVNMRKMISANVDIKQELADIENELGQHNEHFKKVFAALKLLMGPVKKDQKQIGFIKE